MADTLDASKPIDLAAEYMAKFGRELPETIRHCSPIKVDKPCSKCGSLQSVYCFYYENGGATMFYDNYDHVCLECGHHEHNEEYGGQVGYEDHAYCHFCGRLCA